MFYTKTHIPCFRCVICADIEISFIGLRNIFTGWCDLHPIRSNIPHTYDVTSFGLDESGVSSDVMTAGVILNAIVRHEARSTAPSNCEHTDFCNT